MIFALFCSNSESSTAEFVSVCVIRGEKSGGLATELSPSARIRFLSPAISRNVPLLSQAPAPMAESAPLPAPVQAAVPTAAEKFTFDNQGYLVLENFLTPDHVARLTAAIHRAVARRRELVRTGAPQTGFTQTKSEKSTRFFYIFDDDPLFLELLDWPALMPYVHALINPKPHHHGSDVIVEHGADFLDRKGDWHIDGHDHGYRNLGHPIPLLQLKVGFYISDMTAPWQGNLTVVPGSHKEIGRAHV